MDLYTGEFTDKIGKATALSPDPIRPESELESILHANPNLIVNEPLLIIGRQAKLESGEADLLACDKYGNVVICEVKIGQSGTGSASEGSILSQPQEYGSCLHDLEYEALEEYYHEFCSQITDGKWAEDHTNVRSGILQQDVEAALGTRLEEHQFNNDHRLVVVAEEITQQTAANVRYLLKQGVHFQATAVKRFSAPGRETDDRLLANDVVVDYNTRRVRPERRLSPTHPELASEILELAFPEFQSLVEGDSVAELLPNGLDTREHRLISNNPSHPKSVVYRLDVKPDSHRILIGIDITSKDEQSYTRIQKQATRFSESGFTVTENKTYRVVFAEWNLDNPRDIDDLIEQVAHQYARLVQLGHDTLAT